MRKRVIECLERSRKMGRVGVRKLQEKEEGGISVGVRRREGGGDDGKRGGEVCVEKI
jgi:hypothetical protein